MELQNLHLIARLILLWPNSTLLQHLAPQGSQHLHSSHRVLDPHRFLQAHFMMFKVIPADYVLLNDHHERLIHGRQA